MSTREAPPDGEYPPLVTDLVRTTPKPERYTLEFVEEGGRFLWRLLVGHTGEVMECKGFMPLACRIIESEIGGSALLAIATYVDEEMTDLTAIAVEHEECDRG